MAIIKGDSMVDIDGHFQIKVGSENETRRIQTRSKPHPNPLVDGTIPVIEDITTRMWRVYFWNEDYLVIETDKKQDTIDFLRKLRDEAQAAIDALEAME